jgi:hypothetical protein
MDEGASPKPTIVSAILFARHITAQHGNRRLGSRAVAAPIGGAAGAA